METDDGWTAVASKVSKGNNGAQKTSKKSVDKKAFTRKACVQRLMRDWTELAKNPIPNCSAMPLESNIREWHVNLKITEIPEWNGTIVHLELHFPEDYPLSPPKVISRPGLPHANCLRAGQGWEICADIFQTGDWSTESQKARKFTGWTSAYSVTTILLQLQVLALDKRGFKRHHHGLTPEISRERLGRYSCARCDHKWNEEEKCLTVWPEIESGVSTVVKESPADEMETSTSTSTSDDEMEALPCCPTIQPVVQGNLSTYDRLRRLDKSEQKIMGWMSLNPDTLEDDASKKEALTKKESTPEPSKLVKLSLPQNVPVWAKLNAKDHKWRHAVLVKQKPDLSVLVRFPDKTVVTLPTSLISIPKPIQNKFGVDAFGVRRAPAGASNKKLAIDRINLINANYRPSFPCWGRAVGNWYQCKLLKNFGNGKFRIKINVGGEITVKRDEIKLPQPLITKLCSHFQGHHKCHPPRGIVLPRNTLAKVLPNKEFKEATDNGKTRLDIAAVLKSYIPAMVIKDFQDGRYRVAWQDYKKEAETVFGIQVLILPKAQAKIVEILNGKEAESAPATPVNPTVKANSVETTPTLTENGSASTVTSDPGQSEDLEADPFHGVEKLHVGDEVIVRKKSNMGLKTLCGTIKSVGNNYLFGVVFENANDGKMEFINRSQVLYYKLSQEPEVELNVDPTKAFIMNLGPNELFHIMRFCTSKEISRLSSTCKDFTQVAKKSFLWRVLYERNFGKESQNQMKAVMKSSDLDWRQQYMLENEQILYALRCFHTKKPFYETILGIPLEWTQNPRTKRIDYITSTCDLISVEAVDFMQLRTTLWKQKFTDWLPVYINHHHFKRALPRIQATIRKLAKVSNNPKWKHASGFKSGMVLDVLPQLLKTFVVLIADKGLEFSEEALTGYCIAHRLFIALCLEYPALRTAINERVAEFIKSDLQRGKGLTPDLGNFVTLLSVCDKFSWKDVCAAYLKESYARSILWACRKYSGLHTLKKLGPSKIETERIERMWECSRVGGRHLLFNVFFLTKFCRNRTMFETSQYYDRFFGRPARHDMKQFQKAVQQIMDVHDADKAENWNQFFRLAGLRPMSGARLTALLRDAVRTSVKKGYTNNKMDFSKIHKSGVSKILLSGESYSVSPTIKKLKVEDVWQYKANEGVKYVDFAMLAINYDNTLVRYVDWRITDWSDTKGAKIATHSSDIYYEDQCKGKQLMTVHLRRVPMSVERLVFTGSTWSSTFASIIDTDVLLTDDLDNAICCGKVNDIGRKNPDKTMCCMGELVRKEPGKSSWEFVFKEYVGMGTTHSSFASTDRTGYGRMAKSLDPPVKVHKDLPKNNCRYVCECPVKPFCNGACVASHKRSSRR